MQVPLLDLKREPEALTQKALAAIERVVRSGMFILGPEVDALEKECAAFIGAKHAIAVSSGTDALILALLSLGIGPGDEVVCPTFTFFATAGAIWRTGAKPVFIDCADGQFNAHDFAKGFSTKTKAVMPVHLFGEVAELPRVNVPVIEDAAQAIGAKRDGKQAGTFGAFGAFSFFPSKNLGAFGDAGLVTTDDDTLAEKARVLRVHGMQPKYFHKLVGGNFRIDALQAAVLRVRLPELEGWTAQRRKNAVLYRELLSGVSAIALPKIGEGHIVNQFTLRVPEKRDALQQHLREKGVGSEIYYPVPLHLQECFASLGHKKGDFPNAEKLASEVLALPIFPSLTEEEIRYVAKTIGDFFN